MQIIGDFIIGGFVIFISIKIFIALGIWGEKKAEREVEDLLKNIEEKDIKKGDKENE